MYAVKIIARCYSAQYEHIKRDMVGCVLCAWFKFPVACFCQDWAKFYDSDIVDHLSYHKYNKGDVFTEIQ